MFAMLETVAPNRAMGDKLPVSNGLSVSGPRTVQLPSSIIMIS